MPVRPVTGIVAGLACLAAGVATTSLVGSSYAAGAGGLPTHVNSCWTTDNGAPVVDSFTLSTHAVDLTAAPATVTITVDAHDAGGPGPASGLAGIQVLALQYWADSSDTGRTNAGAEIPLHLVGTDWAGTYTIPQDSHAMQVQFTVGVDAVKGPDSDPLQPPATDILEVTSGHPDTTAPTLTDLSLSTDHVDVSQRGQNVRVTAQIADDDTGLSEAKVFAREGHRLGDENQKRVRNARREYHVGPRRPRLVLERLLRLAPSTWQPTVRQVEERRVHLPCEGVQGRLRLRHAVGAAGEDECRERHGRPLGESRQGRAAADLDVVRVRAEGEHRQRAIGE